MPDATGGNPFWASFGYPGPSGAPRAARAAITPLVPQGDELASRPTPWWWARAPGGGVIAASLAEAGLRCGARGRRPIRRVAVQPVRALGLPEHVLARRPPAHRGPEHDAPGRRHARRRHHDQLDELPAHQALGARAVGAANTGSTDVDGPDFDGHLDAVCERLSVNDRCSDLNGTQEWMKEGAEALGWSFTRLTSQHRRVALQPRDRRLHRLRRPLGRQAVHRRDLPGRRRSRAAPSSWCAASPSGCWRERPGRRRRGLLRRPRRRAAPPGDRPRAARGRGGRRARVARRCCCAPASAGRPWAENLRLHPCTAVFASYAEDQRAWWGAPHAGLVDEFADVEDGYGFLLEATQYAPGTGASALPFTAARRTSSRCPIPQRRHLHRPRARPRRRAGSRSTPPGQAMPWYSLTDELDVRNTHRALDAQMRLHLAAGAREISALAGGLPRWRVGDDVEPSSSAASAFRCERAASALRRPPDGHLPDGHRPADERGRPRRRAARHARGVDRRRQRLPDAARAPTR